MTSINGTQKLTKTEKRVSKACLESAKVVPSPFRRFRFVRTYQLVKLSMNFINLTQNKVAKFKLLKLTERNPAPEYAEEG